MKKFALLTNYSKDKRLVYTRMIKTYITENGRQLLDTEIYQ